MPGPVFSASWYRVAALRPVLRRQARIVRHTYRGERWYVLQDLASGRFLRLDPTAYRIVALMDGVRSMDAIWTQVCGELGDDGPTQDETLGLLAQLHQANVLLTDQAPDSEEMRERARKSRWTRIKQYVGNPLSLKIPVWDPDRFVGGLVALFPRRAGAVVLLLWAALVASGAALGLQHWNELTTDVASRVFTPEMVLLVWLTFPVLKILHELGHAVAVKAYGGSCHEMGLMFLVLMPVPYVDASGATGFPDKRRRMVVGLAGMMAELAVASAALWLWTWSQPGVFKSALHQAIVLAGITTLIFNANPLLRYDGYYVLADWLEIPNLGQKSNRYLGHLLQKHVLRLPSPMEVRITPREGPILCGYAVASYVYRMFVAAMIILFVAGQFFFVGVLMAIWAAATMVLQPIYRVARTVATDTAFAAHRGRTAALALAAVAALAAPLSLLPIPAWTETEAVIWVRDEARVRAPHPCFAERLLAAPGETVRAGDPLLTCADPELDSRLEQAAGRVAEIDARLALAVAQDRTMAREMEAERAYARELLADLALRHVALTLRAPVAGVFQIDAPADLPGRFLQRGDQVAYVLDPQRFTLLSVVPQGSVDLVRRRTERVELRPAGDVHRLLPAEVGREVPAATRDLPSLALALQGGGRIGLDPDASPNSNEPRALTPLFQFEIRFAADAPPQPLGARVYVRFVHSDEPLAQQWYRSLRQLFLERFSV
jgi:putative peptide zinc metalloprotease protein